MRLFIAIDLNDEMKDALADAGIPFARKKFSPHVTIIRRGEGRLSDEARGKLGQHFGASMIVDHISLMRSDRGRNGMIYTEL